ncbi:MAG: hypothetical protein JNK27_02130 [Chitinophagaceae bacterium]|nr:hypothetical protein [Chitinophagaceae bacterium]
MTEPVKLYESLFILHKCNLNISRLLELILEKIHQANFNEDEALLLAQYLQMESVSFIAEFKENLYIHSEKAYSQRIADIQKITRPIFNRINKWKDLNKYRNNIIAHPWRDSGKFVIPNSPTYNVPKSWLEITVLGHYMKYVWAMVAAEFIREIRDSLSYMNKTYPFSPVPIDFSGLNEDQLKMAAEVDSIRKELNKNYYLKVLQFEFSE